MSAPREDAAWSSLGHRLGFSLIFGVWAGFTLLFVGRFGWEQLARATSTPSDGLERVTEEPGGASWPARLALTAFGGCALGMFAFLHTRRDAADEPPASSESQTAGQGS